jgi:hypothetical protein
MEYPGVNRVTRDLTQLAMILIGKERGHLKSRSLLPMEVAKLRSMRIPVAELVQNGYP